MTPTMWLTLVAALGMTILILTVVRARHPLAAPLSALIADMLVWNLAWLAYVLSDDDRWRWLAQCAASLVAVFGLDFVLTFVGRRRELANLRRLAYAFLAVTTLSTASRFVVADNQLYVGDIAWRWAVIGGGAGISAVVAWLLIGHHLRHQRDTAERAHTRLLILGFVLWTVLATTDLLHRRVAQVPKMSAVGMLLCAAVMTMVMDRVRPQGLSRWWALYAVVLFSIALGGNFVAFSALPITTAMMLARTVILVLVGVAAGREAVVILAQRRRRLAGLALVGRVTAQMAHDLQNPLAAIKCAAQVIEEDLLRGADDEPRHQRMLAVIRTQAERLSAIVEDYRRLEKMEPRVEAVTIADCMQRVAAPADVAMVVALDELPPCLVDPELMARVLDNLVQNAADAMPDGGKLMVSGRVVEHADGSWVEVTVRDEGCGMDARVRERVFDDFFTTKSQGRGLGLTFVRRVTKAHGGDARVVSRLGHGTQVILRLPAADQRELDFNEEVHAAA